MTTFESLVSAVAFVCVAAAPAVADIVGEPVLGDGNAEFTISDSGGAHEFLNCNGVQYWLPNDYARQVFTNGRFNSYGGYIFYHTDDGRKFFQCAWGAFEDWMDTTR
jgi:hypothetical protein